MTVADAGKVAVVGVGRTGAATAVGLAHLGQQVHAMDLRPHRIAELRRGALAEAEPGLRSALRAALRFRSLSFTSSACDLPPVEAAFLCVDTPSLPDGAVDMRQLIGAAATAAAALAPAGTLVVRSTVPVGTCELLAAQLAEQGRGDVHLAHMPEFLREGRAWEDFREPDRIVLGAEDGEALARIASIFAPLQRPVFLTDLRTAEFSKCLANAWLATNISFANEMADLGETLSVDVGTALRILRADARVGERAPLVPGLGFGGHCLPKDTSALQHLGGRHGERLPQLRATREVNDARSRRVLQWLEARLHDLSGRRITLAGIAFKPGTDDTRLSPALRLAAALTEAGACLSAWDPHARSLDTPLVQLHDTLASALEGSDALVIAYAASDWLDVDPVAAGSAMRRRLVYDAPRMLAISRWHAAGFESNRPLGSRSAPVREVTS